MSNELTDKEVAEKVMGWTAKYPEREPGDHFSAAGDAWRYGMVKPRYPNGMTEDEFHPTTKISHAYMVIDKMREDDYYLYRVETPMHITLHFSRPEDFGDEITEEDLTRIKHTREPLGICKAAMAALK